MRHSSLADGAGTRLHALSPAEITRISRALHQVPELGDEVLVYRVIGQQESDAIQRAARSIMPAFLAQSIPNSLTLEPASYRHENLGQVELTPTEVSCLVAEAPEPITAKAKSLMSEHWSGTFAAGRQRATER